MAQPHKVSYSVSLKQNITSIFQPTLPNESSTPRQYRFATQFYYTPLAVPLPITQLRATIYKIGNAALFGPLDDPEGWQSAGSCVVWGTMFGTRNVELRLEVSNQTTAQHSIRGIRFS